MRHADDGGPHGPGQNRSVDMKLEAVVIPGSDADRAEAICDPWLEVGCEIGDALLRPGVAACARAVLETARLHLVIAFTTAPHE
jgi:hypothetical protein